MGGVRTSVLVALATISLAAPAAAAPTWHQARTVDAQYGDHVGVHVDDAGETVLAWQRPVVDGIELMAATRPRGGGFSAPALIAKGVSSGFRSLSAGRFTMLMWSQEREVWAALREAGGQFGAPQRIATGAGSYRNAALNAAGDAVLVYSDATETVQLVRRSRAGALSAPVALSATRSTWPSVALAGDGSAFVVWERIGGGLMMFAVEGRQVAADGTLGEIRRFGTDAAQLPWVVGAPDGSALLRWIGGDPSSPALRSGHGEWQLDPALHPTAGDAVSAAIRDQGRLRIAWRDGAGVRVAVRDSGGALREEQTVAPLAAAPGAITLAESAAGQALVLAVEHRQDGATTSAAVESGGAWAAAGPVQIIRGQSPSGAVGAGVAAVAAWTAAGLQAYAFDETDAAPAVTQTNPPAVPAQQQQPQVAAPRDTRAPVIGLSRTSRRQRAGTHVTAKVACDEVCGVAVSGKVGSRKLPVAKRALTRPGVAEAVRLKLPAKARKALARRGGRAKISVEAFDAAGNRSLATLTVKIARS